LFLSTGAWAINGNVTVPSNITLWVPRGASVVFTGGAILTLNGGLKADYDDWYSGSGTLVVTKQDPFVTAFNPFIISGCLPTVPVSSTTLAAFACTAQIINQTSTTIHAVQSAATVGPLNSGDGTYWIAIHRDTSSSVSGWTRQGTTRYLWQMNATKPTVPADTIIIAEVTIAGGVITAVSLDGDRQITTTLTLASSTTVRSTATWTFLPGGSVNQQTNTVSIQGKVDASSTQFIFTGTGVVTFGAPQNSVIHAMWVGMRCNGSTVDTTALQRAMSGVTGTRRQVVQMPSGLCMVADSTSITTKSYTTLRGMGVGATVIQRQGLSQPQSHNLFFTNNGGTPLTSITYQDFSIDMKGASATPAVLDFDTAVGLRASGGITNVVVERLHIYDSLGAGECCPHGLLFLDVDGLIVRDNWLQHGYRIKVAGAGAIEKNIWVERNRLDNADDNAITALNGTSGAVLENVWIRDNVITTPTAAGIVVGADDIDIANQTVRKIFITGNVVQGPLTSDKYGILVKAVTTTQDIVIAHNQIHGGGTGNGAGIGMTDQNTIATSATRYTITNNVCSGSYGYYCLRYFMRSGGGSGVVSGNQFEGMRLAGMGTSLLLSHNIFTYRVHFDENVWTRPVFTGNHFATTPCYLIVLQASSGTVNPTLTGNTFKDYTVAAIKADGAATWQWNLVNNSFFESPAVNAIEFINGADFSSVGLVGLNRNFVAAAGGNDQPLTLDDGGISLAVRTGVASRKSGVGVTLYARNDINVVGGAGNDCVLRALLGDGTEVTIATLVTDGNCPNF